MNPYVLCLLGALPFGPSADQPAKIPVYELSRELDAAVRGQSPVYDEPVYSPEPIYNAPVEQDMFSPWAGEGMPQDPFLAPQQPGAMPYGANPYSEMPYGPDPYASPAPFGPNGPQPYRFGRTWRVDVGYLPKEGTTPNLGGFEVFEFDTEIENVQPMGKGWIFSSTPQFGLRTYEGPGAIGAPGNAFRFGWNLELTSPEVGPWTVQFGFNPALASDFESNVTSDAWLFDGFGVLYYRPSPIYTFAFGAAFLDRVNDRVIPYAGVVITPDDFWEFRLLFPQSRISYFLGSGGGADHWFYVNGEFHTEAYEFTLQPAGPRDQVELTDWRIVLGVRSDHHTFTKFIEAGWVFDRQVNIKGIPGADFDIGSGFIARAGIRF